MQDDFKNKKKILAQAVAKTLKKLRERTGKSVTLISNELNISKSIWADVETGKSDMQFSTFMRIVEALEITPEEFFTHLRQYLPENFNFVEAAD